MCGPISRWNRRTALSVHCSLYWFVRRWCLTRKRIVWRSSRANANRACDLVEHPRADLGVTVEVHAVGRERARRDLADVVEQRGPAHERAPHRLPHDLLGVRPDVLVLASGLLDEIDGRLELGEQHAQDAGLRAATRARRRRRGP